LSNNKLQNGQNCFSTYVNITTSKVSLPSIFASNSNTMTTVSNIMNVLIVTVNCGVCLYCVTN